MAISAKFTSNTRLILSSALLVLFINLGCFTNGSPLFRPSKCPVCTDADRASCPALPKNDCEVIEEPNCGCCKMCAKKVGENCGVATGLCETGLECIPPPLTDEQYRDYGPANYFMEAVMGEFICVTKQQFIDILTGVAYDDDIAVEDGVYVPELYEPIPGLNEEETAPVSNEENEGPSHNSEPSETEDMSHLNPFLPNLEPVTIERPVHPPSAPFHKTKDACIYHADKVWGKAHFDRHEWIPSCEEDGTYYPEQCELSFGLERGRCWCVDSAGIPVSEFIAGEKASPELCFTQINKA